MIASVISTLIRRQLSRSWQARASCAARCRRLRLQRLSGAMPPVTATKQLFRSCWILSGWRAGRTRYSGARAVDRSAPTSRG